MLTTALAPETTAPAQRMPSRAQVLAPTQRRLGLGSPITSPDPKLLAFAARYRASH